MSLGKYKCKYCGEELKFGEDDGYEYLYCSCEGQKKADQLKKDILSLENEIKHKYDELEDLLYKGAYGKVNKEKYKIELELSEYKDARYER